MSVQHIRHFFQKSTRAANDSTNRMREAAFLSLNDLKSPFFTDPTYGPQWRSLQAGTNNMISQVLERRKLPADYSHYAVMKKGGLKEHLDMVIFVYDNMDSLRTRIDFEFKFNSMPQFAQLFDKDAYIKPTLAEFWYDNGWVDKMCSPYGNHITYEKPSREEYLHTVHRMMTKKFPPSFFKQFYEFDHREDTMFCENLKSQRVKHVHDGVAAYLETHGSSFDIEKLRQKLVEDQKDKLYGIWNPDTASFKVLEYTKEQMTPTEFLRIENRNTVVLKAGTSEMHLLLRWKNTLGIATPAWQISIR